jgi:hypothetical protein
VLLLLGCGQIPAPKPPERPPSAREALGIDRDRLSMEAQAVDLRLFDTHPTNGDTRKPTLWLHADIGALEEQNIWSFQKARAVIYGRSQDDPEITLEAGSGRFQEAKMAYLKDGVKVHVGKMDLELADFEWINDDRLGRTDHPITVRSDDLQLTASSMRLYPDDRRIQMKGGSGMMRIERGQ